MTIGQRIKIRREQLNLSQEELAKKIGYKSRSSINKIELDLYNLKQSKIKVIANALDTTPAYIMGWDETENSPPSYEDGLSDDEKLILSLVAQIPQEKQKFLISWLQTELGQGE